MKKESKPRGGVRKAVLVGRNAKAEMLVAVSSEIETLEEKLALAKSREGSVKEAILADLATEGVKAFTHAGFDFFVVSTEHVVVKNATAVLDYCRKKFKQGIRESVDKSTLNYHVKQEGAKVPGTAVEVRDYLRFSKEK